MAESDGVGVRTVNAEGSGGVMALDCDIWNLSQPCAESELWEQLCLNFDATIGYLRPTFFQNISPGQIPVIPAKVSAITGT